MTNKMSLSRHLLRYCIKKNRHISW